MIVELISRAVWFVVTLPVKIVLALRFSAIFTISGFILGLFGGLIAGYFAFIYTEPSDYKVSPCASPTQSPERIEVKQ